MAYNNGNRNYNNGYRSQGGYSSGGYDRGGYQNNRPQKKHSGCKSGTDRNGKPYLQGWKYDKTNGLRKFYATPYNGTKETTSGSGKVWQNWFVRIQMSDGSELKTSGLFDKQQNKVVINQLGFVMNPRGGAGGYVGPYYYKKNR